MNRKILLLEPNYKNKYPPMGLMKLATYYRRQGDDVRFYKGELNNLAAQLLCEKYLAEVDSQNLGKHITKLINHIKTGRLSQLEVIPNFKNTEQASLLKEYRIRYRNEDYPRFDIIAITTLFTFYWKKTINTINHAKHFCSENGRILVGGIAATILPGRIYDETGIKPVCGLLDKPNMLDNDNDIIIDELPLDYSILEEIEYQYPSSNAYLAYMTRGCINKCKFCAVPRLEPSYVDYIGIKDQIEETSKQFGPKRQLLLMDNNVFASKCFNQIIEEIKECGFEKGATFIPENEYLIAMNNLNDGYNNRAYIKKLINIYDQISNKLPENEQADFYIKRESYNLLYPELATPEMINMFDIVARPLYSKYFKHSKCMRFVDFNQGLDARLVTEDKMAKLAETNIRPLRIAFDHYSMKKTYIKAIRIAAKYGIKDLSNYLLYNYYDKPDDLYYRMQINVDLCNELNVTIYSFPMKYHPIDNPKYFSNREYIGRHWNRKFIRSIQAVLNATKGKIGQGKSYFQEAFGATIDDFHKILWMPEAFIIHRFQYKDNLTAEWWDKYCRLDSFQLSILQGIVANNIFNEDVYTGDDAIDQVLEYYQVKKGSNWLLTITNFSL